MITNDDWICEKSIKENMIVPFEGEQVKEISMGKPAISYGLSSFGYDIRLSGNDFRIFRHIPGTVVDPKNFSEHNLERIETLEDEKGRYFILPSNSYGLGVSHELITMPNNTIAICIGKSTYARCGIIANITPVEPGWRGHLTLEVSNSSNADCRIYANEGIVQLLFLEGEECTTNYASRQGKYQNQGKNITTAIV